MKHYIRSLVKSVLKAYCVPVVVLAIFLAGCKKNCKDYDHELGDLMLQLSAANQAKDTDSANRIHEQLMDKEREYEASGCNTSDTFKDR